MSSLLNTSCFDNIIGITQVYCPCQDDNRPEDYDVSKSGLYLDGLLPMNFLQAAQSCEYSDMWTMAKNAIFEASKHLQADLFSCIRGYTSQKRTSYKGTIVDVTKITPAGKSVAITNDYAGMKLDIGKIRGGKMTINRIGTYFAATSTIDLTITDTSQGELMQIIGLPTVANQIEWYTLQNKINLSLADPYNMRRSLSFLYPKVPGLKAKESRFSCNCGGWKPYFDYSRPTYDNISDKGNYGYANYLMAAGVTGNDLENIDSWMHNEGFSYGIILDVTLACSMEGLLCNPAEDYETDPIHLTIAHTLRYKAAEIIIDKILKSGQPTRYTMVAGTQLLKDKADYQDAYNSRVMNYLCTEISNDIKTYSDCYVCRDAYEMRRVNIPK